MSTKKHTQSKAERMAGSGLHLGPQKQYMSLVHQLEDTVLSLEAVGQTDQDIFSMVHMIMRGFIRNGELTQEYVALAQQAMEVQQQGMHRIIETPPGFNADQA